MIFRKNTNPFLPYIDDFDREAETFLKKYGCEDAIDNPQRVPIYDIATKRMSLEVIQTECLSFDDSVQGAIAFSKGVIEVYDPETKEFMGYPVSGPAIFVDSGMANEGRINNTIAHECFHWYKHREYFVFERAHNSSVQFGIKCDARTLINSDDRNWSDVEKMEWQARTIAPKILMPLRAAIRKTEELFLKYEDQGITRPMALESVISEFAEFYGVSVESAKIRIREIGFWDDFGLKQHSEQLGTPYGKQPHQSIQRRESKATKHLQTITPEEAFKVYLSDDFFRQALDTGEFRYADGFFALKDSIVFIDEPEAHLSDYAKAHLFESVLDFTEKLVGVPYLIHGSDAHMMYRKDTEYERKTSLDANTQNTELFNKAKELKKIIGRSVRTHMTPNERLLAYMEEAGWKTENFLYRTGLNEMALSRLKKKDHKFKKEQLISIGYGLQIELSEMEEVLDSAGMSFSDSDPADLAYKFLFTGYRGKDIESCNDLLKIASEELQLEKPIPLLGSHDRG